MAGERLNLARLAALIAVAGSIAAPRLASAQEFELHRWRPASGLRDDFVTLDAARADLGRGFELGAWFHYADDPLIATANDVQIGKVVTGQLVAHVVGAFEVADRFRLTLDLPAYLLQSTDRDDLLGRDLSGGGIGDIRLVPKVELYDGRADGGSGVGVALLAHVWLPTGDPERLQGESFRGRPVLALDWGSASGFTVGANVGVTLREQSSAANLNIDEELAWGAGVSIPLGSGPLDLVGELNGSLPLSGGVSSEELPLEFNGMLRAGLEDLVVGFGGGAGLLEGWGSPDFRAFAMLGYSPSAKSEPPPPPPPPPPAPPSDRDGDGYLDEVDGCPDDPEDFDGLEDEDGCPETDVDGDGDPDDTDACDWDPEDVDGWQDDDGCPDPDNDDDRILDAADACPGVDGDALPDVQENYNDFEDTDGCPDELAELTDTHIQINGIIYFDLDSDVIQARSLPVVDAVARIMDEHPEITLVEIAGHTDIRATDAYNLDLSQRRTQSVRRALIDRGVDGRRMTARGYGEGQLADLGTTEEAHQRNRRVEFRIIERAAVEGGE